MSSLFYTAHNCLLCTSRVFFSILIIFSLFVFIEIVLFERNFQTIVESRRLRTNFQIGFGLDEKGVADEMLTPPVPREQLLNERFQ